MRRRNITSLVLGTALLAACSAAGPPLAGLEGGQWAVVRYYEQNAWERGATCPSPRMRVLGWRIVEQTPERTIVDVRYSWWDESRRDSGRLGGDDRFPWRVGGGFGVCEGFGERQFVLVPGGQGGSSVRQMTGEQRPR